jgi:hypothetical protein
MNRQKTGALSEGLNKKFTPKTPLLFGQAYTNFNREKIDRYIRNIIIIYQRIQRSILNIREEFKSKWRNQKSKQKYLKY